MPTPPPIPFPVPRPAASHNREVFRWMGRRGLRHLLDLQRAGEPLPSRLELTQFLWGLALEEGKQYFISDLDLALAGLLGEPTSTFDQFHSKWLAKSGPLVAAWVLEKYRPSFLNAASKGGRTHRPRRAITTGGHVRPYADLPAKEVAEKLGISVATVYRVRAASRKWDAENPPLTPDQRHRIHKEAMQLVEVD